MSTEFKQADPVPPFAQATGYATDEVSCEIVTPDGRRLDNVAAMCAEMQRMHEANSAVWTMVNRFCTEPCIDKPSALEFAFRVRREMESHNNPELSDGRTEGAR